MALSELKLELVPGVDLRFVKIPAGEFIMGSDKVWPGITNQEPQSTIHLAEYWMGKYQVTNLQYWAFDPEGRQTSWDKERPDAEKLPVRKIDLKMANGFCAWASQKTARTIRLPTEAEWEKAARGTDGRTWPWGNDAPQPTLCNYSESYINASTPVGKYSPQGDSPYGCADMAGNIFELTNERMVRGGYFGFYDNMIRCAVRWPYAQDYTGFRVLLES